MNQLVFFLLAFLNNLCPREQVNELKKCKEPEY